MDYQACLRRDTCNLQIISDNGFNYLLATLHTVAHIIKAERDFIAALIISVSPMSLIIVDKTGLTRSGDPKDSNLFGEPTANLYFALVLLLHLSHSSSLSLGKVLNLGGMVQTLADLVGLKASLAGLVVHRHIAGPTCQLMHLASRSLVNVTQGGGIQSIIDYILIRV